MKVLHVLNDSLPSLCGYTIRSASILQSQSALGIEPVAVTSPHHEPPYEHDLETVGGLRHYRTRPLGGWRIPFLHEIAAVRALAARIDEVVQCERPDVLHAHSPCLWGEAAARVARRRRLPLVYEIRGFWEDAAVDLGKTGRWSPRYRLSRAWETRVARRADVVVTICGHLKDDLVKRGIAAERIALVPNGVNTDEFAPREPDAALLESLGVKGCVCVGYVGTFNPWEGVEDLIRAAPGIVARAPQTRFLIVGTGKLDASLRELIRRLDVAGQVLFIGKVRHEEVGRYYSVLDVLVYPRRSTRNTELVTPLKPLEAMAMEKAVLGSDVGGIRELLAEGTGIVYRAGDPADLAEKCLELLTDAGKRRVLGANARRHVVATRHWSTLAMRYVDVYAAADETHRRREAGRGDGPRAAGSGGPGKLDR